MRKVYVLTVVGPVGNSGGLALRGLFVGDDEECFKAAAELSLQVNFTIVPTPIDKVINVPHETLFRYHYYLARVRALAPIIFDYSNCYEAHTTVLVLYPIIFVPTTS